MLPTINVTHDLVFNELLDVIKKYYPVGMSIRNEDYEGYKKIDEILNSMYDQIKKKSLPNNYQTLIKRIKASFKKGLEVRTGTHNFPHYSVEVDFPDRFAEDIKVRTSLCLKISLLTKHYTVFFHETNFFLNFPIYNAAGRPCSFDIFSSRHPKIDPDIGFFNGLISLMTELYPDYTFISHNYVFNYKVPDVAPLGHTAYPGMKPFSIYEFLFDSNVYWENFEVAQ
jgi:hypothetical protein